MANATEVKRGRGRPESFPGVETKMTGFNLPVSTLELLSEAVVKRNKARKEGVSRVNQNTLVNTALRAFLRNR